MKMCYMVSRLENLLVIKVNQFQSSLRPWTFKFQVFGFSSVHENMHFGFLLEVRLLTFYLPILVFIYYSTRN